MFLKPGGEADVRVMSRAVIITLTSLYFSVEVNETLKKMHPVILLKKMESVKYFVLCFWVKTY